MEWTVLKLLQWSETFLRDKGVDSPRLDAELLLSRSLNLNRVQLYMQFDRPLDEEELAAFKSRLKRRAAREPLSYILGEREFFSLAFEVDPSVLIPRPETEELVERGLSYLKNRAEAPGKENPSILDLATGSGCLLLALLKNFPGARGIGLDVSAPALELAKKNAARLEVSDRVDWIEADLSRDWGREAVGPFALITANLPYVSEVDWRSLAPEVRDFEPKGALVPGEKGTEAFTWVLPHLPARLEPGGLALLEIGMDQGERVLKMAGRESPEFRAEIRKDLAGKDRILQWSRAPF